MLVPDEATFYTYIIMDSNFTIIVLKKQKKAKRKIVHYLCFRQNIYFQDG